MEEWKDDGGVGDHIRVREKLVEFWTIVGFLAMARHDAAAGRYAEVEHMLHHLVASHRSIRFQANSVGLIVVSSPGRLRRGDSPIELRQPASVVCRKFA